MQRRALLNFTLVVSIACALSGCGQIWYAEPSVTGSGGLTSVTAYDERSPGERNKIVTRAPWEKWSYGVALDGSRVSNLGILRGDHFAATADYVGAMKEYQSALKGTLPAHEKEALILRIAAIELTQDRPEAALLTISNYFRSIGAGVESVDPQFGLILGYAYGRKGDIDQSLAWFGRVAADPDSAVAMRGSVESAIQRLLATLPEERFESYSEAWMGDAFMREQFGVVRSRRSAGPATAAVGRRPFWEIFPGDTGGPQAAAVTGSTAHVGALLPLSGRFASLGTSAKRGIEIALSGAASSAGGESPYAVAFRDSGEDPVQSMAEARNLIASEGVSVILGPLLSEHYGSVSEVARQERVPFISMAKRGFLPEHEGEYHFAPTTSSQVRSLLTVAVGERALKRFAIVFTEDQIGSDAAQEFRSELARNGLAPVLERSYLRNDTAALLEIAKAVEEGEAEAVFFTDGVLPAARFFASIAEHRRRRITPLGLANWDDPEAVSRSAGALENALFVSPFFLFSERPEVRHFVELFRVRYGGRPDFLAAQGFDAATLAFAALREQAANGGRFSEALLRLDAYAGLTGMVKLEPSGELGRSYSIVELKQGKMKEIVPGKSAVAGIS